jgi:hypothetical protein
MQLRTAYSEQQRIRAFVADQPDQLAALLAADDAKDDGARAAAASTLAQIIDQRDELLREPQAQLAKAEHALAIADRASAAAKIARDAAYVALQDVTRRSERAEDAARKVLREAAPPCLEFTDRALRLMESSVLRVMKYSTQLYVDGEGNQAFRDVEHAPPARAALFWIRDAIKGLSTYAQECGDTAAAIEAHCTALIEEATRRLAALDVDCKAIVASLSKGVAYFR